MKPQLIFNVNEEGSIRFSNKNCLLFMQALIRCRGSLLGTSLDDYDESCPNTRNYFDALISLPEDKVEKFKEITGFILTEPEQVKGM